MVLVTGGTGFVGAHLLYQLVATGEKVRAIKRSSSSVETCKTIFGYYTQNIDDYFSKIEWIEADLLDLEELTDALQGIKRVYHAAAVVSFDSRRKKEIIEVNQKGTANLVNLSILLGIEKFCFVSSIASLGNELDGRLIDESSTWKPTDSHSTYSLSKFWAEMEVWRGAKEGLNVVIVNPSVIVGAGNWKKGSSKFFPTVYYGLKYYGTGSVGFVGVEDVARAMIILMNSPISNERFVLNSENRTYKEFLFTIANEFKVTPPSKQLTPFIGNTAWRLAWIWSKIVSKEPLITRETISTSFKTSAYSAHKIEDAVAFKFTPIKEVIAEGCKIFIADLAE